MPIKNRSWKVIEIIRERFFIRNRWSTRIRVFDLSHRDRLIRYNKFAFLKILAVTCVRLTSCESQLRVNLEIGRPFISSIVSWGNIKKKNEKVLEKNVSKSDKNDRVIAPVEFRKISYFAAWWYPVARERHLSRNNK